MPDLTGIPALDLLIGLSFIYLLLSLFCSAVQEAIAGLFALRAKKLEEGLHNMLADNGKGVKAGKTASVADPLSVRVLDNPLIRSLYKDTRIGLDTGRKFIGKLENRAPSYIAPRTFALALLDTLAPPQDGKSSKDVLTELQNGLKNDAEGKFAWIPANTKKALIAVLADGRADIDRVRGNIEAWFDDSMARVSGWYKRQAQIILCVLALLLTVAINADTLQIGQVLWKDESVRSHVVAAANSAVAPAPSSQGGTTTPPTAPTPDLNKAATDVENVEKLGVPLGWNDQAGDPLRGDESVLEKIAGWFLTFVALSLGAPFWFDALSRLARLRNAGKPESPLPAPAAGQIRAPDSPPADTDS